MSEEFKDYYEGIMEMVVVKTNNIPYAETLVNKNFFRIKTGFYEDENPSTIVEELVFQIKEHLKERGKLLLEGLLIEGGVTDGPVREIVRTLTFLIKDKKLGTTNLPEQITDGEEFEYDFKNIPPFSIEFNLDMNTNVKGDYRIESYTVDDGFTIIINLDINTNSYPKSMYDIIADLNDNVAHEMEHLFQKNMLRPDSEKDPYEDREEERPQDKRYYEQPHEIPAELKGFRRIKKLRNEPIDKVVRDWFYRNRSSILNDYDINELVVFITDEYHKRYPNN